MNDFTSRNRCAAAKKPFLWGKSAIFRVFSGTFMKMNAFQGKRYGLLCVPLLPSKRCTCTRTCTRNSATPGIPESGFWNSGILEFWNSGTPQMDHFEGGSGKRSRPSKWPISGVAEFHVHVHVHVHVHLELAIHWPMHQHLEYGGQRTKRCAHTGPCSKT